MADPEVCGASSRNEEPHSPLCEEPHSPLCDAAGVSCKDMPDAPSKPGDKLGEGAPLYMYLLASYAALNSMNIGFDIGVSSGVAVYLRADLGLSDGEVGLFLGSLHFMAAIGGLCSYMVSDRLGRRFTFTLSQVILLIGLSIVVFSKTFSMLMLGRVWVGLGVGVGLAIDPLYIAEVAPAGSRGKFTTWSEMSINLGILIGFLLNWALAGLPQGLNWRVMVAAGAISPIVLILLSLTVMPESPRWLIGRGRVQEAEEVLRRTHPPNEDTDSVVNEIKEQIQQDSKYAKLGWAPLLRPEPGTRRQVFVGIGVAIAQQINGSESVVLYSPEIFRQAGVATTEQALFAVTILVGVVKVGFIVLSAFLLDTKGRRPLLVLSTIAMAASLWLLSCGAFFHISWSWLPVFAVCSFMAAFSVGIGPVTWLLAAELFPAHVRAKAMSLAVLCNRITSGLVALTFLPLSSALGGQAGYFACFAAITSLTALVSFLYVPETKMQTLESLGAQMQGTAARDAKVVATSADGAHDRSTNALTAGFSKV